MARQQINALVKRLNALAPKKRSKRIVVLGIGEDLPAGCIGVWTGTGNFTPDPARCSREGVARDAPKIMEMLRSWAPSDLRNEVASHWSVLLERFNIKEPEHGEEEEG
jgi:hypothetical protein